MEKQVTRSLKKKEDHATKLDEDSINIGAGEDDLPSRWGEHFSQRGDAEEESTLMAQAAKTVGGMRIVDGTEKRLWGDCSGGPLNMHRW